MATTAVKKTESNNNLAGFLVGLVIVVALAFAARALKLWVYDIKDIGLGIPGKSLEYVLWAALLGLIFNYILKAVKIYDFAKPGFRTELFLKVGLVLLGTTISFKVIATAAVGRGQPAAGIGVMGGVEPGVHAVTLPSCIQAA